MAWPGSQRGDRWTIQCRTTARDGVQVRLVKNGSTVDRDRVKDDAFRLQGRGQTGKHAIVAGSGPKRAKLDL